jgi:hypothetical protein
MLNKKAQEEIAGFAIILVLVGVILLAFLANSLKQNDKENVNSYEADNFLQSALQQTTNCAVNGEYRDIKNLIFDCESGAYCESGQDTCDILENTLRTMVTKSWRIGEGQLYTGYDLYIELNGLNLIDTITDGETAPNFYPGKQDFAKGGDEVRVEFTIYYE